MTFTSFSSSNLRRIENTQSCTIVRKTGDHDPFGLLNTSIGLRGSFYTVLKSKKLLCPNDGIAFCKTRIKELEILPFVSLSVPHIFLSTYARHITYRVEKPSQLRKTAYFPWSCFWRAWPNANHLLTTCH